MSAADVRDVLDLPQGSHGDGTSGGGRRPPAKKQKTVEKRPDGITRELYALLGENPPPVSLKLESRFKERPKYQEKAKPWEWRAFINPARTDGLVLRHWASASSSAAAAGKGLDGQGENKVGGNKNRGNKGGNRKRITFDDEQVKPAAPAAAASNADAMDVDNEEPGNAEDGAATTAAAGEGAEGNNSVVAAAGEKEKEKEKEKEPEQDYHFARFNVEPLVLQYTDEEYAAVGVSDDWSRHETDYLFEICREYDLRFVIIADRYEYYPPAPFVPDSDEKDGDSKTALVPAPPKPVCRSMEEIKHRYYTLTRSLLILRTPKTHMTPELSQYLTLLQFDKEKEAARKRTALALFNRTPEEVKEEELLLIEMKRILANQERLLEERQELFARLDAPVATGSITAYAGSAGLQALSVLLANGGGNQTGANPTTTSTTGGNAGTSASASAAPGSEKSSATPAGSAAAGEKPPTGGPTKKRKSVANSLGIDTGLASAHDSRTNQTPTTAATTSGTAGGATSTSTPTTATGPGHKKSLSTASATHLHTPTAANTPSSASAAAAARNLTPEEEKLYGVAYHEKIASGVYLRSSKVASVKGANQPKVQAALHELGIPGKLTMATGKTCAKMEALNQAVSMLLDAKKLSEKLDAEIRVELVRLENV